MLSGLPLLDGRLLFFIFVYKKEEKVILVLCKRMESFRDEWYILKKTKGGV